jgi:hypothetical protein
MFPEENEDQSDKQSLIGYCFNSLSEGEQDRNEEKNEEDDEESDHIDTEEDDEEEDIE